MAELFANNAASTLASSILAGDLSLTVAAGEGALFPSPSGGDYFHATLDDGVNIEIVRVTARSSDTLTIVRAQQGTAAAGFGAGTAVQIRLTASALTRFEEGKLFRGIRGFTGANYLERAAGGDLDGNGTGFEIYAVLNVDSLERSALAFTYHIASTASEFVGPGYHLGVAGDRPFHSIADGGGTLFGNFLQNWLLQTVQRKPLIPISFGYNGTNRFLRFGGYTVYSAALASYGASTNPFRVGRPGGSTGNPFTGGTLFALAAKTNGVLNDAEHEEVLRTFLVTRDLPDSVFTSRWSFASLPVGAVPATVPDEIGSNDLTLVGSLSVVNDGFEGMAIIGDPAATSVKVGGQIGGTTTSPDVRGARETGGPTLLTYGAIPDNHLFARSGANVVGVPRTPVIAGVTGFSTGAAAGDRDYYERSGADPLASQLNWTIAAMVSARVEFPGAAERRILSTCGEFITSGCALTYNGIAFTFYWLDSGATLRQVSDIPDDTFSRTHFVVVKFEDGAVTLDVNGTFGAGATHATGAYTSGTGFAVGGSVGGAGAANGAEEAIIHGAAFQLTAVTPSEMLAWYRACLTAQTFVPNPALHASAEAWAASVTNPGTGNWTPADGANNLVRTGSAGSISTASIPLRW